MSASGYNDPLPPPGRLRWSNVIDLYIARLRDSWLQELLAVLGIAIGVALLFASQVASSSLSGPVKQLNGGLVGNSQLQLVARGAGGFDSRVLATVRRIPGVEIAAPVLQVEANFVGPKGGHPLTVFGADPRAVKLRGSLLQGFTASEAARQQTLAVPAPIARATGVRFGDNGRLQIDGRTLSVPVATVGRDQIGALSTTSIALAPLAYLQQLARLPGRVSRILIHAAPDQLADVRAGLERLVSHEPLEVRSADYETRLFQVAAQPTSQATTISSVVSAMVGFLFAFCAMLVTVASRRELAIDLRMEGYSPWRTAQIVLFDALVLGLVAVAVGLELGDVVSHRGYGSSVNFLGGAFPLGDVRVVPWSAYAIASAGGLLAAALGVLAPIRRIVLSRVPQRHPDAGAVSTLRTLPTAAGGLLLAAAVAITTLAPGAAIVGLVALTASLALLLPAMLRAVIAALDWANLRRDRAIFTIELASPALRAREWHARSLAIALTGAIAVFGAVALEGARDNLQAGLDDVSTQLNHATEIWASPYGSGGLLATTAFSPARTQQIARTPGVRDVELYRSSFLDVADRRVWVVAPPARNAVPVPASQILDGNARQTARRLQAGGWVTVSRVLSDKLHLRVGDRFVLPSPAPASFRVAAITTNLGWSGGAIVTSGAEYVRGWQSNAISAYQVRLDPGVPPERGRRLVATALGPGQALRVETADQRIARQQASARGGLSRLSQIASLTLIAAVLAMAAAMAALLWQRRDATSAAKVEGRTTGEMWRALALESGVLFATGCLAGAVFALIGQVLFSRGLAEISGFPVIATIRVDVAAERLALVVVVALLIVAVPGYRVARVRPSLRTGDS